MTTELLLPLYGLGVGMLLAGTLLVGSVPGVVPGSRLAPLVPRRPLQASLALLLMSTAISMLK